MRRLELGFLFAKDHTHIPCCLRHPVAVGIRRHAGYVDSSGVQMNKKEHVVSHRTTHRPDGLGEEISGPDRLEVSLDELRPTAVAALRPRIETVILQETFDSCSRDIIDAELLELTQDSTVAPSSGLGHFQNELPDLFRLSGTATLSGSSP